MSRYQQCWQVFGKWLDIGMLYSTAKLSLIVNTNDCCRGSFLERQHVDADAFCFPQDDKRSKIEFYIPLVFYLFGFLVSHCLLSTVYPYNSNRNTDLLTARPSSCRSSVTGIPSLKHGAPAAPKQPPIHVSAPPVSSHSSLLWSSSFQYLFPCTTTHRAGFRWKSRCVFFS